MPYVFFRCNKCERKYSSWSDCVQNALCECGGILVWKRVIYGDPPSRNAQPFEPVVLFRDPTAPEGQYRTPGWSDEPTPAGFERVEIRSIREWEGITRQMSAHGRREAEAAYYERQQAIDKVRSEQRAELRQQMKHWDGPLREFAAHALERSENKQRRPVPTGEVVAHALEYDSSNREAWRDARTGWKERRS